MLRVPASILFLFVLSGFGGSAQAMADTTMPATIKLKDMGFYGRLLEVKESHYLFPNGDSNRALSTEVTYGFDGYGFLKSKRTLSYEEGKRKPESKSVYYSYEQDLLSSFIRYEDDKRVDSTSVRYNRKGRLQRKWVYDQKGNCIRRVQYTFREGRVTAIRDKDGGNVMMGMVKFYYDDQEQKTETQVFDEHLRFLSSEVKIMEPDTGGLVHEMRFLYAKKDTCTGMVRSTLDGDGNCLQQTTTDEHKRVADYRTMTYDEHGNMLTAVIFAGKKLEVETRYKYDSLGNWIQKEVFHNGEPHSISLRSISYLSN